MGGDGLFDCPLAVFHIVMNIIMRGDALLLRYSGKLIFFLFGVLFDVLLFSGLVRAR